MKNLLVSFFKANSTSKYSMLGILFATALLSVSCTENPFGATSNTEVEPEVKATITDNIHVAFAGGGWRAHTAHTAWTMSLLENNNHKLDNVFKNVESIGSNSGGSWFSTMLMYSPKFVTDIETIALADWGDTKKGGWLGGQQNLFDAAKLCTKDTEGPPFALCVFEHYGNATEWDKIVKNIIYKDYPLHSTITLSSPRQNWATKKSLLIAGTMLTNNVVLNEDPNTFRDYYAYYQACLSPLGYKVTLDGINGGSCANGANPDVSPITFSSLPSSSGMTPPPFLPAAGTRLEN